MKKLLLLTIIFCAISCAEQTKLEKPFIIINEEFTYHGSYFTYYYNYQDKNGVIRGFSSKEDLWNVGDIIE